ncbi:MAG: hypothetical protein WBP81_04425, partial [Solirubrobacteraceae bacterium]
VLVGAVVAAAGVLLAAGVLDEAAIEELELDPPPQAPSPTAISIVAMISDTQVVYMGSSLFS